MSSTLKFRCTVCGQRFMTRIGLEAHLLTRNHY